MRAPTPTHPRLRRKPRCPPGESLAKVREAAAARVAAIEVETRKARENQLREDAEAIAAGAAGKRRSGRLRRQPVRWAVEGF